MGINSTKKSKSKILAIDDTPSNLHLLLEIFNPEEYTVFPARSSKIALTLLQSNLPDLILMDINMPEMNGFELCRTLKDDPLTSDIPVIFISGRDDPSAVVDGFAAGGVDYISKPFRSSEVLARVHAQLMLKQYRELLREQNVQLQETIHSLVETQQQLVRAENLSSLNQLISGITHEINTPIGVCITSSSYLSRISEDMKQSRLSGNASLEHYSNFVVEASEVAKIIEDSLDVAVHLINNLKVMTGINHLEPAQNFNACDCLNEIISDASTSLKSTQIITLNCPNDLVLFGSPEALSQIFRSLIANSIVHGFENRMDGEIIIDVENQKDGTIIIYRDNGLGIPEENLNKIFNPFFTTKRGKGNTGLGLFAVYRILTLCFDGTVVCDSQPGKGVRFTLSFPRLKHIESA